MTLSENEIHIANYIRPSHWILTLDNYFYSLKYDPAKRNHGCKTDALTKTGQKLLFQVKRTRILYGENLGLVRMKQYTL